MKNLVVVAECSSRIWNERNLDQDSTGSTSTSMGATAGPDSSASLMLVAGVSGHQYVFAVSSDCVLYRIDTQSFEVTMKYSLVDSGALGGVETVVAMEYMLEEDSLLLAMAEGDLLLFSSANQTSEVVGSLEGGIAGCSWSPDGEVLVLVTRRRKLLLMTNEWEVLAEVDLDQEAQSTTQGTQAKSLPATFSSPLSVQISWRGDAKFFTTISTPPQDSPSHDPRIRVWEREGAVLHSCAEQTPNLFQTVSWRPSGSLIAAAAAGRGGRGVGGSDFCGPQVILYERNGLKRSSFWVGGPAEGQVADVEWNSDSELLAVTLRGGEWDAVQIWHRSNYHWYLKLERRWPSAHLPHLLWDSEHPLTAIIWTETGTLQRIDLVWDTSVHPPTTSAAVIDGQDVRISPLGSALIPPPMAAQIVRFTAPVQCAAIGYNRGGGGECLAAGLADGRVGVVECGGEGGWAEAGAGGGGGRTAEGESFVNGFVVDVGLEGRQEVATRGSVFRQLLWLGEGRLLGVLWPGGGGGEEGVWLGRGLVEFRIEREGSSWKVPGQVAVSTAEEPVLRVVPGAGREDGATGVSTALVQLQSGRVLVYRAGVGMEGSELFRFPTPCPRMSSLSSTTCSSDTEVVGVSGRGDLYVGPQRVGGECTSFVVHWGGSGEGVRTTDPYLVYTTRSNTLHVVPVRTPGVTGGGLGGSAEVLQMGSAGAGANSPAPPPQGGVGGGSRVGEAGGFRKGRGRKQDLETQPVWERGAVLVAGGVGGGTGVALQTVRGNLEVVHPRILVLRAISEWVEGGRYGEAMAAARRHRVDLNVLVDYGGWGRFVENTPLFVKQVRKIAHVTELVCALTSADVTRTVYSEVLVSIREETSGGFVQAVPYGGRGKVTEVCAAIRSALIATTPPSPARDKCILTTLVRSDPPLMEEALLRIKALRDADLGREGAGGGGEELEEALLAGGVGVGGAVGPGGEEVVDFGTESEGGEKVKAEALLHHLMWLADAKQVFNCALGLYDLPLAAMVAANSQKDPKEFLPFLGELQRMEEGVRKYTIDRSLGRMEGALRHLARAGPAHFATCLDLVRAHPDLFPVASKLFEGTGERRDTVMGAWGEQLGKEERFHDAAMAFCAAYDTSNAIKAARAGGHWQTLFTLAGRAGMTRHQLADVAREVREELVGMGKPRDAARVALEYQGDTRGGVELLITARQWQEAGRVAAMGGGGEGVGSLVETAALDCAREQIGEMEEVVGKVGSYVARYETIREKRMQMERKMREAEEEGWGVGEGEGDDVSEAASSAVSGMSLYTRGDGRGGSSRPPSLAGSSLSSATVGGGKRLSRRAARKAAMGGGRIRAGSPGEEKALTEHIEGLPPSARLKEEIGELLELLLVLGQELLAQRLQQSVYTAIKTCQAALTKVIASAAENVENETPKVGAGTNGNVALPKSDEVRWKWIVLENEGT